MRTHGGVFGLIGVVALIGACGGNGSDGDSASSDLTQASSLGLDVNDVSILFPLGDDGLPRPNVMVDELVTDPSGNGASPLPLWTDDAFEAITTFAQSGVPNANGEQEETPQHPHLGFQDGVLDKKNWRIVSMRFDPCASNSHPVVRNDHAELGALACVSELRLIAQPFVDFKNGGKDQDVTAHLVYNLGFLNQALLGPGSKDVVAEAARDLQGIKAASQAGGVDTSGQPLGVHPGLGNPKSQAQVAALVKAFILKYAGKARDVVPQHSIGSLFQVVPARVIAFMAKDGDFNTLDDAPEWYFFKGNVLKDDKTGRDTWTPDTVDALQRKDIQGGAKFVKLSFKPTAETDKALPDIPGHLVPESRSVWSVAPLFDGTSRSDADAMSRVKRLEDPTQSNLFENDCVTCHTTTSRTFALHMDSGARVPAPSGITALARRDALQASVVNLRNFGYFETKPTVSMRTVNETALVADYLNQMTLRVPNPSKVQVDDAAWRCCMGGGSDVFVGTPLDCASVASGICAAPATRRTAVPEPKGKGGDPCDPGAQAEEKDPRFLDTAPDGTSVTLHGQRASCLALSINGSFFSDALDISCIQLDRCNVDVRAPGGKITGDGAKRLRAILFRPEHQKGDVPLTFSLGKKRLSLTCSGTTCTVSIAR
jgi:hypothetical protein